MTQTDQRAARWRPFGTTIFAEMSALAREHDAVNLSQGFPDEDGPAVVKDAAVRAIREEPNQYAPMPGVPALTGAIAAHTGRVIGRSVDAAREVTVTDGCTEALAATFLGLFEPGDEVVLFEPFYDSYRACCAMAGAVPRFVRLRPEGPGGRFGFDEAELRAAFTEKTRAILVNSPHNPTGRVFGREELELIAGICRERGVLAITDEVYEHLIYDGGGHVSLASLDGMAERTVVLSSLGKTFSLTGWKIGWAVAPPALTAGVRAAHQFLTYAVATPLQHAAAVALTDPEAAAWVEGLRARYRVNRDWLSGELARLGFGVHPAEAGYFVMADHAAVSDKMGIADDVEFCRRMTAEAGVAAIPPSAFYSNPADGRAFVRFAFCKREAVLREAARRLEAWIG